MNLGENIKSRRENLKLSQECVAERLGVSRQAVSKWETGQFEPTASNLILLAEVFEISLSELVNPQKNDEEQTATEKERNEKKPNPILQANLTKWAIIFQAAFLNSSVTFINNLKEDRTYIWLVIFSLVMLAVCSTWMASNHRFETDRKQRRRNVNIELCYCIVQATVFMLDIRFGLRYVGTAILIIVGLVYILYVNPRFMSRKLTK